MARIVEQFLGEGEIHQAEESCFMPEDWNLENDMDNDGEDGLFDEGDGLNDEEEADGWVMEV